MDIEWLYFVGIGLVLGLIIRDRGSGVFLSIVAGVVGAVLGGWLFKWIDMFAYDQFMGACAGAILFMIIKRGTAVSSQS